MKRIYIFLGIILLVFVSQIKILYAQGKLWGIASQGGTSGIGVIFNTERDGSNFTIRHEFFTPYSGATPLGGSLVEHSNGKFYGVTSEGGIYNKGVLFEFNPTSGVYIKRFDFNTNFGFYPRGGLVVANNGKLYGLASLGGNFNSGTIFEFDPTSNICVKKYDFDGITCKNPGAYLTKATNGKLYGETSQGGLYDYGVLFEFDPITGSFSRKRDFNGPNGDGRGIGNLILANNGLLYGVHSGAGSYNTGILYEFNPNNETFTNKYNFTNSIGYPRGTVMQASNGKFYGFSGDNSNLSGYLYEIDIAANNANVRHTFNQVNTGAPSHGNRLVQASNGKLYSLAVEGGVNGDYGGAGVLFEFDLGTFAVTKKFDFGEVNGEHPQGSLLLATNGKLYGHTTNGGNGSSDNENSPGKGVIFEYDYQNNIYSKKIDFQLAPMGAYPESELLKAANGKYYGLTSSGGQFNYGTIFEFDKVTSTYSVKHNFDFIKGATPRGKLIEVNNKLYGFASRSEDNRSILFEYDYQNNIYSVKKNFIETGLNPESYMSLVLHNDGYLYGLALDGGSFLKGAIFKFSPTSGILSTVYEFNGIQGSNPFAYSLIKGENNKLYGLTPYGGSYGKGVIFEFDPGSNIYSKIHDFDGINFSLPRGPLLQFNGKLFGATSNEGIGGKIVFFEFDIDSRIIKKNYEMSSGYSHVSIAKSGDGNFYGTFTNLGLNNAGLFFRFNPTTNVFNEIENFNGYNGAIPFGVLYSKAEQTITFGNIPQKLQWDNPFNLTYATNEGLPISYLSSDPNVASIEGNLVTILKAGVTTITASQAGDESRLPAADVQQVLTIRPLTPSVQVSNITIAPKYSTQLQINFTPGNGNKRLVVIKQGSEVDFTPVEETSYSLGEAGNGNRIVKNDGGNNVNVSGLLANTVYFIKIFEFNENNGHWSYLKEGAPSTNFTTLPLPNVVITSPANNLNNQNVTLTVSAQTLTGATTYTLELSTSADFSGTTLVKSGSRTQSFTGLQYSKQYFARVKTNLSPDYGNVTTFFTGSPEHFAYVTNPVNLSVNRNINLSVTSNTVIGATTYTIEVNTLADFSGTSFVKSGGATQTFNNLLYSTTYYTRVKTNLSPNWGGTRSFTTGNALALSYVVTPSNNAINQLWSLNVTANALPGASVYKIQVSTFSDFSSGVIENTSSSPTINFNGLAFSTKYYTRVSTDLSPGEWGSTITNFTTNHPINLSYITTPSNNAINIPVVTNLTCLSVVNASLYTVEVNTTPDFSASGLINSSTTNIVPFVLNYNTKYYVRVKTNLSPEWGVNVRSFTTSDVQSNSYVTIPANNAISQLPSLNITANPIIGSSTYTIQVSPYVDFSSEVKEVSGNSNVLYFTNLNYNTKYYTRVTSNLSPGLWGPTRSFTTIDNFITSPVNSATNVPWSTNIVCNSIAGTTSYMLELNTSLDFSGISIIRNSSSTTFSNVVLGYDQKYYARVKSNLAANWGSTRSFTTGNPVSLAFVTSPSNGASGVPSTTFVTANLIAGATSYTIELNTAPDFSGISIVKSSSSRSISFTGLTTGTIYYNRVYTNLAPNQWGQTRSFTTSLPNARVSSVKTSIGEDEVATSELFVVKVLGNPFEESLLLTVETPNTEVAIVKLVDLNGKVLHESNQLTNSLIEIKTNLTVGVYILYVQSLENFEVIRVVKD